MSNAVGILTFGRISRLFPSGLWVVHFAILAFTMVSTPALGEDLFPDKALEAAVRKEVYEKRYNEDPLTKEDVKNISVVRAKGKGIKSLAGLEHCQAVQEIDLEDNEITDISQLADLKLLQSITLTHNQIESLKPLEKLERVQYLALSDNQVKDISPIDKMSNMRTLYLSNNQIRDISVLAKLPKIWTLYVAGNPIEDFAPIGELKWLGSLDLRKCGLSELEFLSSLTELKYLNLNENQLESLETLVEMAKADERKRFSPYWRIHIQGNPLGKASEQIDALQKMGARITKD